MLRNTVEAGRAATAPRAGTEHPKKKEIRTVAPSTGLRPRLRGRGHIQGSWDGGEVNCWAAPIRLTEMQLPGVPGEAAHGEVPCAAGCCVLQKMCMHLGPGTAGVAC